MRTLDSTTEMLFSHVAVPAEDLQMIRETHLSDVAPPITGVTLLPVLFPVAFVIQRQERDSSFTTAGTFSAVVRKDFTTNRGSSGTGVFAPSCLVFWLVVPLAPTIQTFSAVPLSFRPRLTTRTQSAPVSRILAVTASLFAFFVGHGEILTAV